MWKPGQLVTIEGKVYRICHDPKNFFVCNKCALRKKLFGFVDCTFSCEKIKYGYIYHSYFKQVYPKT